MDRSLPAGLGRDFYLVQLSALLNAIGARCGTYAIAWWVLEETGDYAVFGYLVAIGSLADVGSRALFSWMGDRYSRQRIVAACYLVGALTTASLALFVLLDVFKLLWLSIALAILGVCLGVREPVQSSMVPMLVPRESLERAMRVRSAVLSSSVLAGPIVAGAMLGPLGVGLTLSLNALATFAALGLLLQVRVSTAPQDPANFDVAHPIINWYWRTKEGLTAVYRIKPEFHLAVLALAVNFALVPLFAVLLPSLVQGGYGDSTWLLGAIEGAFALGLLCGSIVVVKRVNSLLGRPRSVLWGFATIGLSMIAAGYAVAMNNGGTALWLAAFTAPALFLGGIGLALVSVNTTLVRSLATPDNYRNRVMASVAFFSGIVIPFGIATGGLLASGLGISGAMIALGLFVMLATALAALDRRITAVLSLSEKAMDGAYSRLYPNAFSANTGQRS